MIRGKPPRFPTALQHHPTYRKGLVGKTAKKQPPKGNLWQSDVSALKQAQRQGQSHANYILRQDKYKDPFRQIRKLERSDMVICPIGQNMTLVFFGKWRTNMNAKTGSVYREHILTLPRELNESQRLDLVRDWIKQEIGDKHPYTYAIHNPLAL